MDFEVFVAAHVASHILTETTQMYSENTAIILLLLCTEVDTGQAHSPEKRISVLALSSYRPSGFISSDRGFQSASRVTSGLG